MGVYVQVAMLQVPRTSMPQKLPILYVESFNPQLFDYSRESTLFYE